MGQIEILYDYVFCKRFTKTTVIFLKADKTVITIFYESCAIINLEKLAIVLHVLVGGLLAALINMANQMGHVIGQCLQFKGNNEWHKF